MVSPSAPRSWRVSSSFSACAEEDVCESLSPKPMPVRTSPPPLNLLPHRSSKNKSTRKQSRAAAQPTKRRSKPQHPSTQPLNSVNPPLNTRPTTQVFTPPLRQWHSHKHPILSPRLTSQTNDPSARQPAPSRPPPRLAKSTATLGTTTTKPPSHPRLPRSMAAIMSVQCTQAARPHLPLKATGLCTKPLRVGTRLPRRILGLVDRFTRHLRRHTRGGWGHHRVAGKAARRDIMRWGIRSHRKGLGRWDLITNTFAVPRVARVGLS